MVSGDDQLGKEIERQMPWVKYATVKTALNLGAAEVLPEDESARRIERAAQSRVARMVGPGGEVEDLCGGIPRARSRILISHEFSEVL